jgi:hypothetical protein
MKTAITTLMLALAFVCPAAAQSEATVSVRAFGLLAEQRLAAHQTFDATVGSSNAVLVGGGLEFVDSRGWFLDVEVSHFSKDGQRVFVSDGRTFPLGINLTVSETPLDALLGYRLRLGRSGRFRPYAAVGVTSLGYKETSDFADASDNVDTRKAGPMFAGGLEVRIASLLGVSADVGVSRVTGILGSGGASAQFGEDNAGGAGVRFRVIVGR